MSQRTRVYGTASMNMRRGGDGAVPAYEVFSGGAVGKSSTFNRGQIPAPVSSAADEVAYYATPTMSGKMVLRSMTRKMADLTKTPSEQAADNSAEESGLAAPAVTISGQRFSSEDIKKFRSSDRLKFNDRLGELVDSKESTAIETALFSGLDAQARELENAYLSGTITGETIVATLGWLDNLAMFAPLAISHELLGNSASQPDTQPDEAVLKKAAADVRRANQKFETAVRNLEVKEAENRMLLDSLTKMKSEVLRLKAEMRADANAAADAASAALDVPVSINADADIAALVSQPVPDNKSLGYAPIQGPVVAAVGQPDVVDVVDEDAGPDLEPLTPDKPAPEPGPERSREPRRSSRQTKAPGRLTASTLGKLGDKP